jgi:hypothetical protein
MVPPAPVHAHDEAQIAQLPQELETGSSPGESTTQRYLRAVGFHVLAVLLGIALAFM